MRAQEKSLANVWDSPDDEVWNNVRGRCVGVAAFSVLRCDDNQVPACFGVDYTRRIWRLHRHGSQFTIPSCQLVPLQNDALLGGQLPESSFGFEMIT